MGEEGVENSITSPLLASSREMPRTRPLSSDYALPRERLRNAFGLLFVELSP